MLAPLQSNQSTIDTFAFANVSDNDILPSESASQLPELSTNSAATATSILSTNTSHKIRQQRAPATEWLWAYFETTVVDDAWIIKKSKKRRLTDREICCRYVDDKTSKQCSQMTTDSQQQSTTSNMKSHLVKHSIYPPGAEDSNLGEKQQTSVLSLWGSKEKLTH